MILPVQRDSVRAIRTPFAPRILCSLSTTQGGERKTAILLTISLLLLSPCSVSRDAAHHVRVLAALPP